MKRYVCTVFDRRGHKGDCMRKDKNGRYVEYSDAVRMLEHVRRECDARLAKANRERDELLSALVGLLNVSTGKSLTAAEVGTAHHQAIIAIANAKGGAS